MQAFGPLNPGDFFRRGGGQPARIRCDGGAPEVQAIGVPADAEGGVVAYHAVGVVAAGGVQQVQLRGGQVKKLPVQFNVDNYPGESFTGSVYLISPSVSMASRAFGVGALVTNTDFRLKANTFARGTLVLERAVPTPMIPLEAVVSFAGVTKVFVVETNVARARPVRVGRIQSGRQEIVAGLRPGETVVISGQSRLSDGTAVAIQTSNVAVK